MELTSSEFKENEEIPVRFTGEGEDISPPLEWSGIPKSTKSFALLCEDPDSPRQAGKEYPYVHWLIYNIPPTISSLPEGLPTKNIIELPVSAAQGKNSFGKAGYGGPMPPIGHGIHHYKFTLHALDEDFNLPSGLDKKNLEKKFKGHILATAKLVGIYERTTKSEERRRSA